MRTVLTPLIAALLLLLAGAVFWTLGEAEEQVVRVKTQIATMDYGAVGVGATGGDDNGDRDRSLAYATRVPGVGGSLISEVRDGHATADYWLARYDALALDRDVGGALVERDPDLLLLAANAAYRSSRLERLDRETALERLEAIVRNYADVLKSAPDTDANEALDDAAYNYELTARMRRTLERARAGSSSAIRVDARPSTIHGRPGGPPKDTPMEQFRVVVPRRSDERNQDPEGGQGQERIRKG